MSELFDFRLEHLIAVLKHEVHHRQASDKQQQHCTYLHQISMSLHKDAVLFAIGGEP